MSNPPSGLHRSSGSASTEIGIVVVTYESDASLGACLASLRRHESTLPVVVVDNNSPSGPPKNVGVPVIESDSNPGYGGGCNLGSMHPSVAGCAYLMFLNPDVELTGPSVTQLALQMETMANCGAATGVVVDRSGARVATAWGEISLVRTIWALSGLTFRRVRGIAGRFLIGGAFTSSASMARESLIVEGFLLGGVLLVRSEAFHGVGGFDEGFFMGWDDADLGRRLRSAGWELWTLPTDPIVHFGGASSAGTSAEQRRQWYVAGMDRYARKHLTPTRARLLQLAARLVPSVSKASFAPDHTHD